MSYNPPIQTVTSGDTVNTVSSNAIYLALNGKQPTGNYITALTGDVTASGPGSVQATIANAAVTGAKIASNTVANSNLALMVNNTIKGNISGVSAAPSDLSGSQVTSILTTFTSSAQGVVSASGGGTTNFLRADGTWAAPGGLPSQTGNQYKVLSTSGSAASWNYAGLGDGSFGTDNTIVGQGKPTNLSGSDNTLLGVGCSPNVSSGTRNTLVGSLAGNSYPGGTPGLTTGYDNVLVGYSAGTDPYVSGQGLSTQFENVGIGSATLVWSSGSIAIGHQATTQISGRGYSYNIAIGWKAVAGNDNYGGVSNNISIGKQAQCYSSTASIAIGGGANGGSFGSLGTGFRNIALGYSAIVGSANDTIIIGANSGNTNATGSNNTIVGNSSFNSNSLSSSANNTIIGYNSGARLTTGSNSVMLGAYSGKYATTSSNELFINNADTGSYANDQTTSLVYGTFNSTTSAQTFIANAKLTATYGLIVSTLGYGLTIKSGSNAKIGTTGAFPGTNPNTVTVSTTAVTANSDILLTIKTPGSGGVSNPVYVSSITPGTGFVLATKDISFNGTVNWFIVEQG